MFTKGGVDPHSSSGPTPGFGFFGCSDLQSGEYGWQESPDCDRASATSRMLAEDFGDDFRRMLTLARLAGEQAGTPAARAAQQLLTHLLDSFQLGQRQLTGSPSFQDVRARLDSAIEELR